MKKKNLLSSSAILILLVVPCMALQAQHSTKYTTLCKTWMAETIEARMHFPLDTTLIVFSRSLKVDTLEYAKFRMTFNSNGDYSSISKNGKPSAGQSKWELSQDESVLIIKKKNGKNEQFSLQRINPTYLELGSKKRGINMVFKMVPEKKTIPLKK